MYDGSCQISNDYEDEIGHGTAIVDIILSNVDNASMVNIIMIKIFKNDYMLTPELLNLAIEYSINTYKFDIMLIASGFRSSESMKYIESNILKLIDNGVVVISAFDNNGAVSYPAAFASVIGVDSDKLLNCDNGQYHYLENSIVNIVGYGGFFRVKWSNGVKNIVKGNSFTAAQIVALIINKCKYKPTGESLSTTLFELKTGAVTNTIKKTTNFDTLYYEGYNFLKNAKKAIVFPFNKEIHSIAKFEKLLKFNIVDYFDVKHKRNIGKKISDLYSHIDSEKIIKDVLSIDWESDFDLIILGHVELLSKSINMNYVNYFFDKAKKYNKKIYAFDDIKKLSNINSNDAVNVFTPTIDNCWIPHFNNDKLRIAHTPIIGVFGTSSQQGKYTLQLHLRSMFMDDGYRVAQIGTEPSGYLFGFDAVFPIGYNSSHYLAGLESISTLNQIIFKCEDKKHRPDVIIAGSQSGSVTYAPFSHSHITLAQTEFIMGLQPDLVVLCVNEFDELDYISRTKKFIEGVCECKVIAYVVYSRKRKDNYADKITYQEYPIDKKSIYNEILDDTGTPMYTLNSDDDLKKLYNSIIVNLTK